MKVTIALKPWFFATGLITVILLFVFLAHASINDHHDSSLRLAAHEVLKAAGYTDTRAGDRINTGHSGHVYRYRYSAEGSVPGSIALVRLQGSFGPVLAVFFIKQSGQAELCGIAGVPLRKDETPVNQAIRMGITPRNLERWIARLHTVTEGGNK